MPKVHPPTERDAAIIANAVRFDIALFIGRGKYAHASARTLAEARNDAAPALEAEHPSGRRALIYAIDAEGRSALVTDKYEAPHQHDSPDDLPEFLCRKCHPELNMTPERRRELDAADAARQARERAEAERKREIERAKARLARLLSRGEPETDSVQSKIATALRNKLARLQHANSHPALVTDDISTESQERSMKTYAKKFNAQRAAKAAGHNLDEIEIVKAKDGFTWQLKQQPKRTDARNAKLAPDPSREPRAHGGPHPAAPKRPPGKRAQIEADARAGKLPDPPDFSAETHKRFRNKLAAVVALANAGDLEGLRAFQINPVSSSPKAIKRYRDLCIVAIEARRTPSN